MATCPSRISRALELDPENPVVALCAAGMVAAGAAAASDCFARAWAAQTDDFEAAVAAHYVARTQPDAAGKLEWDLRAVWHAEAALAAGDGRVRGLLASFYLNAGDGLLQAARRDEARDAITRAEAALAALPGDGYGAFVAGGVARLRARAEGELRDEAICVALEPKRAVIDGTQS